MKIAIVINMSDGNAALDLRKLEKGLYETGFLSKLRKKTGRQTAAALMALAPFTSLSSNRTDLIGEALRAPSSHVHVVGGNSELRNSQLPDYTIGQEDYREGRSYQSAGFLEAAQKQKKSRWTEYKDWLKQYPLVKWKNVPSICKIPIYKALEGIIKNINKPAEQRKSLVADFFYGILDTYQYSVGPEGREGIIRAAFPRIEIERDFGRGASNIHRMHTIEYRGVELPVYIQAKTNGATDPEPTDDGLRQNIKHILEHNESYYNDSSRAIRNKSGEDKFRRFYNDNFSKLAATKLTRLDFGGGATKSKIAENELLQIAYPRWFARQEAWWIQQYNSRDTTKERDVTVDGTSYHINCYKRPPQLSLWWYWKKGDKIYDYIRTWVDPIFDGFERLGFTESSLVPIILGMYKRAISTAHRGFSNPRSPAFAFEVPAYA